MGIPIRARQVHLDFHNSEHLPDVGSAFDARRFQEALRLGRVNHVNVFAKCAQGWSYYPTTVGTVHPTLRRNLLGEQIEACRQVGVRAPIYYCVGFSDNDQRVHPSWSARGRDGSVLNAFWDEKARPEDRKPTFSWPFLCPTGAYRDLVLAQTREICGMFPVDGFWFDVCACSGPCFCDRCRAGMKDGGLDVSDDAQSARYYDGVWESFLSACSGIVRERFPEASIFFNGTTSWGHDFSRWQTQLEMEDLPTSSGGYDRLPLRCKHYAASGLPLVGMTGKFHTSWGEFGGFKHPSALRYECAAMISWSAACSVGDQLHPTGEVDLETYRLVGEAFRYVEQIEEYGLGGLMCSNLGLWITAAAAGANAAASIAHDQGVASMLLESQHDFEAVGPESDLSRYRTIILPGGRCLDAAAAEKVRSYLDAGGTVLALYESALGITEDRIVLPVGAEYVGPGAFECDYLEAGREIGAGVVTSPILHNYPALRVRPRDAQILARIREPYFNRTYGHYVSHQNTPHRPGAAAHPGALRSGGIVYLPHPLGRIYRDHGARVHRDLFLNALHLLYSRPTLEVRLPSAGRVNLLHQPDKGRYVVHLLYAPPLLRGTCLVIDDLPPLFDVPVRLRVPQTITRAYLAPQGGALSLVREPGGTGGPAEPGLVSVVVPRVEAHQAVVFQYGDALSYRHGT